MPLTGLEIRTAKPGARIAEFSDGGALQSWIRLDGAKRWRLAYRRLPGDRPSEAREEAERLLADGQDPAFVKKVANAAKRRANGMPA